MNVTANDVESGKCTASVEWTPLRELPEVYQVLVECRDEEEQRELYERLVREGRRVRLLVLLSAVRGRAGGWRPAVG